MKSEHHTFMERALELSKLALPSCLPNPPVGCVIVGDSQVIAEGHTQSYGNSHAEAVALQDLESTSDLTAYVTLEPCAFQGHTPSCAKALIAAKIKTVYIGMIDPDPRNNGNGIKLLQEAGVNVSVGILEEEIKSFIASYLS